ncbi:hypothetical protein Xcel_2772 [Xylanimonas cellulosilytica DSM 15894]|uniref:BMP family ABC transporter substrate-binding protein n=1 Tax=Xylanimonas cellulosilytica (strain DSM 15894 / JCM 12276 / CECT 5975 / KCTC 9989 / LMG 20990 / NBRC 107835 / XIL07) TaxID=446471 RepID=D1BXZ5_XYLCX|nr:hypothetical protein [Xylanimonas cellulosilytica]ACZ31786.1 hypothetical protein Xcel_2772 [Xylanimonas cellulosilytica DSM 15894]
MRRPSLALGLAVAVTALTACAAPAPADGFPSSTAAPLTRFAAEFLGATTMPAPEATVTPAAGTWDDVVVPAGFELVLITSGEDPAAVTVADAVRRYAAAHAVALTVLPTRDDDDVEAAIEQAVAAHPDLVVGAGDGVVDVFALLTAQHLDTPFLLVGSQLPEPTANVTAVVWDGAGFRGSGLGSAHADPDAVSPERALEAMGAGVTAVLHDLTGIVLDLG